MDIILPDISEVIEIGKRLGGEIVNRNAVQSILLRIEKDCMHQRRTLRELIARGSAMLWKGVVQKRPFTEENRAIATDLMLFFLRQNRFNLELTEAEGRQPLNHLNSEMSYEELAAWICKRLKDSTN